MSLFFHQYIEISLGFPPTFFNASLQSHACYPDVYGCVQQFSSKHHSISHMQKHCNLLQICMPSFCMLYFVQAFSYYFIFVLPEKHAILESVLSGWPRGFEPCTGAGLPLEGAICRMLLFCVCYELWNSRVHLAGEGSPRGWFKGSIAILNEHSDSFTPEPKDFVGILKQGCSICDT